MANHTINHLVTASARGCIRSKYGQKALRAALTDPEVATWLEHRLGISATRRARPIHDRAPAKRPAAFEDLMWLFTPSYAARGLSQLLLDEAVYLYRFLTSLREPRVAEIGRLRGGTTFFLAGTGAQVTSIDNDQSEIVGSDLSYAASLEQGLATADLDSQVALLTADAFAFPVEPDSFDLVYLDVGVRTADDTSRLFDRWWPGVRHHGRLVLRDGREPRTAGVAEFGASLATRTDLSLEVDPPGVFQVAMRT